VRDAEGGETTPSFGHPSNVRRGETTPSFGHPSNVRRGETTPSFGHPSNVRRGKGGTAFGAERNINLPISLLIGGKGGFWDKVLDIHECLLQNPLINNIRNAIKEFAITHHLSFYNPRELKGFLRNLLFRTTEYKNQLMVGVILGENHPSNEKKIIEFLLENFPEITTLVTILNTKKNDSYSDLTWETHKGEGYIYEQLEDKLFRISPLTFFQTNSLQALKLYQTIKSWISKPVNLIYDLYSGCGSIGIFVSDLAQKIIGIEYVPSAVTDAEYNLNMNQINHLQYFAGDMSKLLTHEFIKENGKPEVIITDPPRAGMDEKVVKKLLEIESPMILYVSCNPSTQARDLQILSEKYELERVQAFDMFPHAHHVENLAMLKLKF
jgi:23S rRNA (uracil1939-C5)-methyltransferase